MPQQHLLLNISRIQHAPTGQTVLLGTLYLHTLETVMGLHWVTMMGVMGMMVSALPFDPYDCTDYCEDYPIDSLICLQDHTEREADIDKEDHFQLPDCNIPQPPPHTPTGIKQSEAVPSYSVIGLIKNFHPK